MFVYKLNALTNFLLLYRFTPSYLYHINSNAIVYSRFVLLRIDFIAVCNRYLIHFKQMQSNFVLFFITIFITD